MRERPTTAPGITVQHGKGEQRHRLRTEPPGITVDLWDDDTLSCHPTPSHIYMSVGYN